MFLPLLFCGFWSILTHFASFSEPSGPQNPCSRVHGSSICKKSMFSLRALFLIENGRNGAKRSPQIGGYMSSFFEDLFLFGLLAVAKRSKIAPGALQEGHEASKRALGPLSEASGPHFGASETYFVVFHYFFSASRITFSSSHFILSSLSFLLLSSAFIYLLPLLDHTLA